MLSGRTDGRGCFRILLVVCSLSLGGGLSGCGSGNPYSYVKVTGKVTYADGSKIPAPRVHLTFIAENPPVIDEKTFAKNGSTDVTSADGTFDYVTSKDYGDGLLPGKHKVMVQALDDREQPLDALIPLKYRDKGTTPIEVDTANLPLVILVDKPVAGAKGTGGPERPGGMPVRRPK